MKTQKFDNVLIDGKYNGIVVQDGCSKSLVSTRRSDGQRGSERDWYNNDRLTVTRRRRENATGNEASEGITLY